MDVLGGKLMRRSHLRSVLGAVLAVAGTAGPAHGADPVFSDVAAEAGIVYRYLTGPTTSDHARMAGGAAAGDYDGDGWIDLLVTRYDGPPVLFRNVSGTFVNVSEEAGFGGVTYASNGAAFGDFDNDGDQDLYVTALHDTGHYLYINDGLGHFTEEALARGAAVDTTYLHYGWSVAVGDYDRDGWLDLYVAEWNNPLANPQRGIPSHSRLLHNRGPDAPGHFEDVTESAGVSIEDIVGIERNRTTNGVFSFTPRFSDLDNDGWPDLAIASDFNTSRLFWNNGDGTFTDGTTSAGVGTDENGMGSAIGDYDGDGLLDWFVTSIYDPDGPCPQCNWGESGNRLYRNDGGRRFSHATDAAGVRNGGWGWGTSFFDYDNDADLDLIMTNGVDMSRADDGEKSFRTDPMRLWRNDGAVFRDVSVPSGITDTQPGKGLLVFDYDNDGDLDVFVVNNPGVPVLYRNDADGTHGWLRVKLVGTVSNRDGIGARVIVAPDRFDPLRAYIREIDGGSNYLGQSERVAHFGLGAASGPVFRVQVIWPSGIIQEFFDVEPNRLFVVTEPAS